MDAHRPTPRWEDDKNKAEEILQLIEQMKRHSRQMIIAALVVGLLLGFVAGASYWSKYGGTKFVYKEVPARVGAD